MYLHFLYVVFLKQKLPYIYICIILTVHIGEGCPSLARFIDYLEPRGL